MSGQQASNERSTIEEIRARASQNVTEIVANPREYYRVQQLLRDRADLLAHYDDLQRDLENARKESANEHDDGCALNRAPMGLGAQCDCRRANDLLKAQMDAMEDCIGVKEGQTFEERAEELIVTEVQHMHCTADEPCALPRGPARIAAQIAHAMYHVLDDWAEENAQTGEVTVEIPADQWKELNRVMDLLGDDPHEVLHDLIGVNDPPRTSEPPSDVQRDAERWRALIGCARVRVMGSAGIHDPKSNYAHIGVRKRNDEQRILEGTHRSRPKRR